MKKYANYNIKIDANPIISNDIYLRSMNDLRKKQIYFDFTEEQFKKEFTTNNVVKTILYKENNKYILLNGFIQTYRKDNKYELTFEIRYIFHSILEKNSLEKILGKLLYNIFIDYKVQYIMYQNIGNNIILDDLYDFINGHSTYLYLYNQKYREIKKEDFYFFF